VYTLDIGNTVICDFCNQDYTDSDEIGGIVFGSYAACPLCSPRIETSAKKHNEQQHIARPNDDERFCDFVIRIRGGNNTITIHS